MINNYAHIMNGNAVVSLRIMLGQHVSELTRRQRGIKYSSSVRRNETKDFFCIDVR